MPTPHQIIAPPNPGQIIGRVELLRQIHAALQNGQPVALVHGTGGIGKTTAACAYAWHPDYSADYEAVCWLEVVGTLPEAFTFARDLQRFLGVEELVTQTLLTASPNPDMPRERIAFAHIVEALHNRPERILLLLDNANDEAELRQLVPTLHGPRLRILVTSRADCDDLNPIAVEALPPREAAVLFWQYYNPTPNPSPDKSGRGNVERPEVFDLLASFDYHTLLTEMLGKIGKAGGYTLPQLLDYVRRMTLREEKWQIPVGTGLSGRTHRMPKQTLKAYLSHLFRDIGDLSDDDRALLRRLAVLPNRTHTTTQFAALLRRDSEDDALTLTRQLAALDQRGVPLRDEDGWRLHPLFREVCLEVLAPFTADLLAPLPDVITEMIDIGVETKNWQEKFEKRAYAEELLLFADPAHPDMSYLQDRLASQYWRLGRYAEARQLFEQALAFDLSHFGEKHEKVAIRRSNLANALNALGDSIGAKEQLQLALDLDLENFGEKYSGVAIRRSNLANVLRDLRNLNGAKEQLELALLIFEENLGNNHPNVATVRSNISLVLQDLGDLNGAKEQLELALTSDLENFGENHPYVANTKNNLANVLDGLNDGATAIRLWQEALVIWWALLGEAHPNTQTVLRALRKRGVEAPPDLPKGEE